MSAVALWVRSILRRHRGATVFIAVVTGLVAGLVGATFQAGRRAGSAIDRHVERSRAYDLNVPACPPGVDNPTELSLQEVLDLCLNPSIEARFTSTILATLPSVEATSMSGTLVGAVLDPTAPTGWGRLGLIFPMVSEDPVGYLRHQVLVSGRYLSDTAPDEVMVGEAVAKAGHIRAGDTIQLASWPQEQIDLATDGRLAPQTAPISVLVTGVVRTLIDLQRTSEGDVTGSVLPDAIYVAHGFVDAHGRQFASYGVVPQVRLRGGPAAAGQFEQELAAAGSDWFADPSPSDSDVDFPALRRVVAVEREAVYVFGIIVGLAGLVFIGLTLARQVRRELDDAPTLGALGMDGRGLALATTLRMAVAAAGAALVAVVFVVAVSPLTPLGLARRLEYSHPVRLDVVVLVGVVGAIVAFFVLTTVVVTALVRVRARRHARPVVRAHPFATYLGRLGAVPRVATNVAGGASPRVAVAVGAIAIGLATGAGTVVASFDRVVSHSVRYGAWWDAVVGQYSSPDTVAEGAARLQANPLIADAAGYLEEEADTLVDGVAVPFVAPVPKKGDPATVMASGRPPASVEEVALGASTARKLHRHAGDTVTITSKTNPDIAQVATITGIAVFADPVRSAANAGDGIVVVPEVGEQLSSGVEQSIAVRYAPGADRPAALASLIADFPGSTRLPRPQADLINLQRLRFVPWLIAVLVAGLALGSLVHALVTLLQRHARDLAVLAAMGFTRRQRRRVGISAAFVLTGLSAVVGAPLGIVLGRWLWRVLAGRSSIPSGAVTSWASLGVAVAVALAVSLAVATVAARLLSRRPPAAQLHAE